MSVLHTIPTAGDLRSTLLEDDVPGLDLDGVSEVTMLAMALAPTAFVLVAALQMFGVHAL